MSLLIGKIMEENGIVPSMGSVSSPWDNAVTESLMGVIRAECVHARTFSGREEAALEIFEYIERFYNRARIHSVLGWLSPEEFEKKHMEESRLMEWDNIVDTENRANRLERCSCYARKTLRQAVQAICFGSHPGWEGIRQGAFRAA